MVTWKKAWGEINWVSTWFLHCAFFCRDHLCCEITIWKSFHNQFQNKLKLAHLIWRKEELGTDFDVDASFRVRLIIQSVVHISCPLILATTSAHYRYDHNYIRKLGWLLFVGNTYRVNWSCSTVNRLKLVGLVLV